MGSLLQTMASGNSFKNIHVKEIRTNKLNFYARMNDEDFYVESMSSILSEDGQDSNAVVYFDDSVEDGKLYTLIAGERRYKALLENFKSGIGDGLLYCKVIQKPKDELDEVLRIIRDNANRTKSKEIRMQEVKLINEVWDKRKASGDKMGGRKVEWIGSMIGMSPRMVQNYLSKLENEKNDKKESDIDDQWEDFVVTVKSRFKSELDLNVKMSKKSFTIKFDDEEEMFKAFEKLGLQEYLPKIL